MTDDEMITLPASPPRATQSRLTVIASMVVVAVVLALVVAAYSVYTVAQDRDGWRETARITEIQNVQLRTQLDQGIAEIACRSRANFVTVQAAAKVVQIVSELVAAWAQGTPTEQILQQLGPANEALTKAFEAQDAAIPADGNPHSTCSP